MTISRRDFLRQTALATLSGLGGAALSPAEASSGAVPPPPDAFGVITDVSECIGCRRCEWACNNEPSNDFKVTRAMTDFDDQSIFSTNRRHDDNTLTVVNEYSPEGSSAPVFVKTQCFHCNDPACLSACLVTAFRKDENGAVVYDPWRCMGCRYCLVACPFQIPSYEYNEPLTPRVRKCTLCFRERTSQGKLPACVEICPVQCMSFGKREDILEMAHKKISNDTSYVQHVYGEHEVGGTSWMFISKFPFEELGFLKLPYDAPPRRVENVQHSIFRYFIGPVMLYGVLGAIMWNFRSSDEEKNAGEEVKP